MNKRAFVLLLLFAAAYPALAQKTNDAIAKQLKGRKADKTITLTSESNSSKIMAQAESFDQKEASKAGIQAMNFGMAVFYPGKTLQSTADPINFTFWVMTKKPRFAADHRWTAGVGSETLNLGEAVYAAKAGSNMEYLNFKVSRSDLAKLTAQNGSKFKLASADFTFTPSQLTLIRNFLAVTDVR
jgi:hypothetical protein